MLKGKRRRKRRIQKSWRPGVQALSLGKSDCSNSFRQPRNHYVDQSAQLTTTARLLLQSKRSSQNGQTNDQAGHNHNWIPWIIGAFLVGGFTCVYLCGRKHALASVAAGPAPKVQDKPPPLKACPDPHYME